MSMIRDGLLVHAVEPGHGASVAPFQLSAASTDDMDSRGSHYRDDPALLVYSMRAFAAPADPLPSIAAGPPSVCYTRRSQ